MFERMDLFYDLNLDDLLYTGWKPDSNSGIHLVRAQTTSYQNFWQEMGNVQTLTEAEQEWLHLQFLSTFLPHPAGQIRDGSETFTL